MTKEKTTPKPDCFLTDGDPVDTLRSVMAVLSLLVAVDWESQIKLSADGQQVILIDMISALDYVIAHLDGTATEGES